MKNMKNVMLLAALSAGCHNLPKTDHVDVVSTVKRAWVENRLADANGCLDDTAVQVVSDISFTKVCGQSPKLSLGCTLEETKNRWFRKTKVFYVNQNVKQKDYVVVQLALHEMCKCTSSAVSDRQDSLKFRHNVWVNNSGKDSVEAKVYNRLGLDPTLLSTL